MPPLDRRISDVCAAAWYHFNGGAEALHRVGILDKSVILADLAGKVRHVVQLMAHAVETDGRAIDYVVYTLYEVTRRLPEVMEAMEMEDRLAIAKAQVMASNEAVQRLLAQIDEPTQPNIQLSQYDRKPDRPPPPSTPDGRWPPRRLR